MEKKLFSRTTAMENFRKKRCFPDQRKGKYCFWKKVRFSRSNFFMENFMENDLSCFPDHKFHITHFIEIQSLFSVMENFREKSCFPDQQ